MLKYSKTAIKELTHKYASILRKCALINLGILCGVLMSSSIVNAENITNITDDWKLEKKNRKV